MPNYPIPAFRSTNVDELGNFREYQLIWSLLHYPAGVIPVTYVTDREAKNASDYQDRYNDKVTRAIRSDLSTAQGMPIGVQVISPKWDDEICLGVMSAIDEGLGVRE